jgi:site-specific recombinase XerD
MEITQTGVSDLVTQADVADRARRYAAQSKAANTRRPYQSDWRDFTAWWDGQGLSSLPVVPATVALYLTDLAERAKVSTLQRRLATISQAHQSASWRRRRKPQRFAARRRSRCATDLPAIIANGQATLAEVLSPEWHAENLRVLQQLINTRRTSSVSAQRDEI